ncbi:unnamed protein product, partial [Discosporangium mesarthrocarpum]
IDFGDLCQFALNLFIQRPDVLARYRWRLRYVFVDEFQDTSNVQYRLLKVLQVYVAPQVSQPLAAGDPEPKAGGKVPASPGGGQGRLAPVQGRSAEHGLGVCLFCTGDENQHIYAWRGASTEHLRRCVCVS